MAPSTNCTNRFPLVIIFLYGVDTIGIGRWQILALEVGASTIAGIDLAFDGSMIVSLFA